MTPSSCQTRRRAAARKASSRKTCLAKHTTDLRHAPALTAAANELESASKTLEHKPDESINAATTALSTATVALATAADDAPGTGTCGGECACTSDVFAVRSMNGKQWKLTRFTPNRYTAFAQDLKALYATRNIKTEEEYEAVKHEECSTCNPNAFTMPHMRMHCPFDHYNSDGVGDMNDQQKVRASLHKMRLKEQFKELAKGERLDTRRKAEGGGTGMFAQLLDAAADLDGPGDEQTHVAACLAVAVAADVAPGATIDEFLARTSSMLA